MKLNKAIKDYEDLFLNHRQGHLTEYIYTGEKDLYNNLITENKDYYLIHEEKELLVESAKKISKILGPNINLVEIGPGSEFSLQYKVIPFLQLLCNLSSYTAIDFNIKYAKQAAETINDALLHKECLFFEGDCTEKLPKLPYKNLCLMFLGSTICNFTDNEIRRILFCFDQVMGKNDHLIFAADYNHDEGQLLKAYNNKWIQSFMFNIFRFFKNTFAVEKFNLDLFDFYCEWDAKRSEVQAGLVATQEQKFSFNNQQITIPQGQKYHLMTSRKFNKSFMEEHFLKDRFKIVETFSGPGKSMVLYLVGKA